MKGVSGLLETGFGRAVRAAVLLAFCLGAAGSAAAETSDAGADWPEFRGPRGNGHAVAEGLPVRWSETENVVWKTATPLQGWSTPAVQDGRIWLTAATEDGHDFFVQCVDAATGKMLLDKKLFHCDDPEPLGNNVNGYASPSPVVEPGRVYVHFGTYGTACLDAASGEVLWERTDLRCRHYRGPGSSPILFESLLYLTFDGVDVQYVVALDKNTGKNVWKAERSTVWTDLDENGQPKREGDFRKAYTTPLVVESGGVAQLLSPGSSTAFAYDARTGEELWSLRMGGYTPATRPVYGDGLAYITTGRGQAALLAVRLDGRGDVTDSHVAWRVEGSTVPQEPSPILVDGLLYTVSNNGLATCYDAATGERVWSERLGGNFVSSPIYADGRIYVSSVQGKTSVLQPGRTFQVLATNELESGFMASPAVSGNALILRTKTHLYRIEEKGSGGN
jgi:outer membrane protein assembly factor BamB